MFCINCGFQLRDGVKFCTQCGAKQEAVQPPITEPTPAPVEEFAPIAEPTPAPAEEFAPAAEPTPAPAEEFALTAEPTPAPAEEFAPTAEPTPAPVEEFALTAEPTPAPAEEFAPATEPMAEPAEELYVYEAQPTAYNLSEPAPAVGKKRRPLAVRIIIPAVFGIFIFLLIFAFSLLFGARNTLDSRALSDKIEVIQPLDMVVGDIIRSGKLGSDVGDLLHDCNVDLADIDSRTTLGELIEMMSGDEVNQRELREIVGEIGVMAYISDFVESYERYLLTNESIEVITADKIRSLINENLGKASEISGVNFAIDQAMLDEILDDNGDLIESLEPQEALHGYGVLTSIALSYAGIFVILGFAVLLAALIGVICKSWYSPLMTFGVCAFLSGGILIAAYLLVETIVGMTGLNYAAVTSLAVPIVKETLLSRLLTVGIIAASAGALMIAAAIVINVLVKKAARKKSAA